jgi:anthranilate phosphoribosyltransferase
MSTVFRELLRKVGSGTHTSESLTRAEAAQATEMILTQEATPAQIGAFMIAHRIKRPTGEELAGMLDAYDRLGPKLTAVAAPYLPIVMGIPYDGRTRTAPLAPLTALILAAVGCPVMLHGGRRMPTKEGVPLVELWQGLGVDWTRLSLAQVQQVFDQTLIGFVYLPHHFLLAENLVPYREQIGKRPPFATVELLWCPYTAEALVVSGFVHPPTEEMARVTFGLRNTQRFITVKGLEGSCDLPRDRTCIIGVSQPDADPDIERLLLHPRDYGFAASEMPLPAMADLIALMQAVLQAQPLPLTEAVVWNSGFYLWQCGHCTDLTSGLAEARQILANGKAAEKLAEMIAALHGVADQNSSQVEVAHR